ncbi:uncharacterized protein LOC133726456 [Rosa rugosa]|uniref:uncharacterized protein LOC133726456 n=1 Tax=Rosa rugosa TaxID=74645 RepID=UPI002B40CF6D|nr:uncharacterized protein LOC133726456 [Rosa rugosa]
MASFSPSSKHAIVPLLPVSYQPNSIKSQSNNTPRSSSTMKASWWTPTIATFILLISLPFLFVGIIAGSRIRRELSLGPQAPLVQITALSVHKFNVSETNLTAEWDVKFRMENPNLVSYISFDRVEGFILSEDTVPLAIKSIEPFELTMRTEKEVHMRVAMNKWDGEQPALKQGVLEKMMKDRETGGVRFGVQMAIWATYRTGWLWKRQHVIMNPQCLDLPVAFVPGTTTIGFGILMGAVPRTCYVPMLAD